MNNNNLESIGDIINRMYPALILFLRCYQRYNYDVKNKQLKSW
jgi:hypothetical protein